MPGVSPLRRRGPPRRVPPPDLWLTRMRLASFRFRNPLGINSMSGLGRGVVMPELASTAIPEPDEELPDSDLSDNERNAAIQRERWRRDGGGR